MIWPRAAAMLADKGGSPLARDMAGRGWCVATAAAACAACAAFRRESMPRAAWVRQSRWASPRHSTSPRATTTVRRQYSNGGCEVEEEEEEEEEKEEGEGEAGEDAEGKRAGRS